MQIIPNPLILKRRPAAYYFLTSRRLEISLRWLMNSGSRSTVTEKYLLMVPFWKMFVLLAFLILCISDRQKPSCKSIIWDESSHIAAWLGQHIYFFLPCIQKTIISFAFDNPLCSAIVFHLGWFDLWSLQSPRSGLHISTWHFNFCLLMSSQSQIVILSPTFVVIRIE